MALFSCLFHHIFREDIDLAGILNNCITISCHISFLFICYLPYCIIILLSIKRIIKNFGNIIFSTLQNCNFKNSIVTKEHLLEEPRQYNQVYRVNFFLGNINIRFVPTDK